FDVPAAPAGANPDLIAFDRRLTQPDVTTHPAFFEVTSPDTRQSQPSGDPPPGHEGETESRRSGELSDQGFRLLDSLFDEPLAGAAPDAGPSLPAKGPESGEHSLSGDAPSFRDERPLRTGDAAVGDYGSGRESSAPLGIPAAPPTWSLTAPHDQSWPT